MLGLGGTVEGWCDEMLGQCPPKTVTLERREASRLKVSVVRAATPLLHKKESTLRILIWVSLDAYH